MHVLVIGGTRFVGYELVWRLLAAGHRVSLFNRGRLADPFGPRVERLRGDRATEDFPRLLAGRAFDPAVDFAAYRPEAAGRAGSRTRSSITGRCGGSPRPVFASRW